MKTLTLRFVGTSPLMQHNPAGMQQTDGKKAGRKEIPSPDVEAERGVYRAEDGTVYHPAEAFRDAIIDASTDFRIGKKAAPGVLKGALYHREPTTQLFDPDTDEPLREYVIDTRRAVVQGQGIMRSRPRFERWAAEVEFEYDDDLLRPEIILQFGEIGGRRVGVGEYRPKPPSFSRGKGGPFGRFTVELVGD